jgi:dTDP-glucose pyrophosphorylase
MNDLDMKKYIVSADLSIRDALKHLDKNGEGILVIYKNDKVYGIVTDGDIRRAILADIDLTEEIIAITNTEFIFISRETDNNEIKDKFKNTIARQLPVIEDGQLIDIVLEEKYFLKQEGIKSRIILPSIPVVVMAGGKGTRLDPFTRVLPKPLIPIGNDPIIKHIMDRFAQFGLKEFYVAINEKGRMIKAYFYDNDLDYRISYIEEKTPLGTAGALKYLRGKIQNPFFVTNCDIIIKSDYSSILEFHKVNNYAITIVGSMHHHSIPYGVCKIKNGGDLLEIEEKPSYDILINTGFYVIDPIVLKYIPANSYFDMTDLINIVKSDNLSVGVYPISQKSWIDIGQWSEYHEAVKSL